MGLTYYLEHALGGFDGITGKLDSLIL